MVTDCLIVLGIVSAAMICVGLGLRLFVATIARELWR